MMIINEGVGRGEGNSQKRCLGSSSQDDEGNVLGSL